MLVLSWSLCRFRMLAAWRGMVECAVRRSPARRALKGGSCSRLDLAARSCAVGRHKPSDALLDRNDAGSPARRDQPPVFETDRPTRRWVSTATSDGRTRAPRPKRTSVDLRRWWTPPIGRRGRRRTAWARPGSGLNLRDALLGLPLVQVRALLPSLNSLTMTKVPRHRHGWPRSSSWDQGASLADPPTALIRWRRRAYALPWSAAAAAPGRQRRSCLPSGQEEVMTIPSGPGIHAALRPALVVGTSEDARTVFAQRQQAVAPYASFFPIPAPSGCPLATSSRPPRHPAASLWPCGGGSTPSSSRKSPGRSGSRSQPTER